MRLALWIGTWPFCLTAPEAFLFLNFFPIPREERMLRELFGDQYVTYASEMRWWL